MIYISVAVLPSEHPYVNRVAYHQSRIFFALDMLDKAHMLALKSFEAFNAALGEHHAWTRFAPWY